MHILISNQIFVGKLNWPAGSGHKKLSVGRWQINSIYAVDKWQ